MGQIVQSVQPTRNMLVFSAFSFFFFFFCGHSPEFGLHRYIGEDTQAVGIVSVTSVTQFSGQRV